MAISIDQAYIETFEDNVRFLEQQKPSRLLSTVTSKTSNGAAHNWERIGPTDFAEKTSARTATQETATDGSRRVSQVETYDNGDTGEQEDIVKRRVDPIASITRNIA